MKRFILFLCITTLLVVALTYYVEYVINRPAAAWLQWTTMVLAIIAGAFYLRYLVNEVQILLNLKKNDK